MRDYQVSAGWRVALGAVLLLAMGFGTVVQPVLGVLAPFVIADLALSRVAFGMLPTAFFSVAAVTALGAGRLVDRFGGRRTLLLQLVVIAAGLTVMGMSGGYPLLVIGVCMGGIGGALINPATNQLVYEHVDRGRQGALIGVKQSGVSVMVAVVGLGVPSLAIAAGWRSTVLVAAVLCAASIVFAKVVLPASQRQQVRPSVPTAPSSTTWPPVVWLSAYGLLMGTGFAAVGGFLVLYSVEAVGLGERTAGLAAATTGIVGVATRIVWARIAERMADPTLLLLGLAGGAVVAFSMLWVATFVGPASLWLGAVLFGATGAAWNAVGMVIILREAPPKTLGRTSGIVQGSFFGGLVVSPILFGWSIDLTDGYHVGWISITTVQAAAMAVCLLWRRRPRR